jgi:TfoX/Sxy family transcriptional regulator of competence genes
MASDPDFVQFILDQIEPDLEMTSKRMFGEFGLYSRDKIIAVVCDDQLFVKPTEAGRAYIGEPTMAPPYPGAADRFLITDQLEDGPWLSELLRITHDALPAPKPKK